MRERHDGIEEFPREEVRASIRTGIVRAEKQKIDRKAYLFKSKKKKQRFIYAFGSVLAIFGILFVSSYFSPAVANSLSQLPLIGSIFQHSDILGLRQAHEKGLISAIGETKEENGISVTLNEILYDQNNITIGLYIESDRELDKDYFGAGMDFTINGKLPRTVSGSYGEEILSPTVRTAIQEINLFEEYPEKFQLGLILRGKEGEKWKFSIPIEKISDIRKIPVHHVQTVDGLTLEITEISISETGMGIAYESSEKVTDFDFSLGGMIEFHVTDQEGNEIPGRSGGATGERVKDKMVYKSNKQFDPLPSHVKELTITPYLNIPSSGGGVEFDEDGKAKGIEWKKGSLQPIEFETFNVKISK